MRKVKLSIVLVIVLVLALGTASLAFAQGPNSKATNTPCSGFGLMNGNGPRGSRLAGSTAGTQSGFLHDEMVAAWAVKLNLAVDEINARLANGETMSQIAYSTGVSIAEFRSLMIEVRSTAIDQAVKNGTLTQVQADWMKTRGAGNMAAGAGHGLRGGQQGQYANPSCPYYSSTNP